MISLYENKMENDGKQKHSCYKNPLVEQRPFKCTNEGCDKAYSTNSHLKRHILTHNNKSVKYKCKYCEIYFSTPSNLKRHIYRIHENNKKFCKVCNKKFRKRILFEEHILLHNRQGDEIKNYGCKLCGKTLASFQTYMKHKEAHSITSFVCSYQNCLEVFSTMISLRKHRKVFHRVKYKCDYCSRTFNTKNGLASHILIHSQERTTFPCTYRNCTRIYYFKKNLHQHICLFHKGKKFKCDICKLKLSTKQKLTHHILVKHQEKKARKKRESKRKKNIPFSFASADESNTRTIIPFSFVSVEEDYVS